MKFLVGCKKSCGFYPNYDKIRVKIEEFVTKFVQYEKGDRNFQR